ncbi:leukocyte elastase inhibitor-like [Schistocerca cancellata]|uniref:leukocyte elastase inhibitor-like n=1 Tax=Schistocerca cancellata TaxID=274614 RepID=UPI00211956BB|nr:leukocyte elastase inhibitor-like [Schistocerca cancellata]
MMLAASLALLLAAASSCQGYVVGYAHFRSSVGVQGRSGVAPVAAATVPPPKAPWTPFSSRNSIGSNKAATTTGTATTTTTTAPLNTIIASAVTTPPVSPTTPAAKAVTTKAPRATGEVDSGIATVATTLRRHLPANENAVLSPLSIASVLAALQMGARGNTARQIATFLAQGTSSDWIYWNKMGEALRAINASKAVTASLANAVVLDKRVSLSPIYEQTVRNVLSSEVLAVDFAGHPTEATTIINQWVSDKTRSKIPRMLEQPLGADTVLAVASALYFNGAWNEQFKVNATRRARFTVSETEAFEVDMMFQESSALFAYDEVIGCQVLGLPYKDEDFALFLVLPDQPGVSGLSRLEQQLSPAALIQLLDSADWSELPFYVPRMKLEASFNLNDALVAAGVTDMFDASKADLSGILSPNRTAPLYVSDVVHRVVMDITESGTEAAAATVATASRSGSSYKFVVDRPFLFVLQHRRSGVPLFWGSVVRPTPRYPLSASH